MFMAPQACLDAGIDCPSHGPFVGFDVGKRLHAGFARTAAGRGAPSPRVDNDEASADSFIARALEAAGCGPSSCPAVVDRRRNIGALVARRALAAGCEAAHVTGKREKKARGLFPGAAKSDAKDAEAMAAAASGMPQALPPAPREDDGLEGARRPRSQLSFPVKQSTQAKNRTRAALVEPDPSFERPAGVSRPWQADAPEKVGGPRQVLDAGRERLSEVARGAREGERTPSGGARRGPRGQPRCRCEARPAPSPSWRGGRRRRALGPGGGRGRGRRDLPPPARGARRGEARRRPARRERADGGLLGGATSSPAAAASPRATPSRGPRHARRRPRRKAAGA